MECARLAYKVEDRSFLLPSYRRFFVNPLLPWLPASLHPNSITHAGHLANLSGVALLMMLWPQRGWAFAVATAMLQFYLWCDNADGAHARRTNQTSTYGEFLDHGLDQLNTVYIAYLTAFALGVSPSWWVALAMVIPAAGAITYWEQTETGVFRLGLLNQVESVTVLSAALLLSAAYGTSWGDLAIASGINLRLAMLLWCMSTILFGMGRAVVRVAQVDGKRVLPALGLIGFGAALVAAVHFGALSAVLAIVMVTAANVSFGMRMLADRVRGSTPRLDAILVVGGLFVGLMTLWVVTGHGIHEHAAAIVTALVCFLFGQQTLQVTRDIVRRLGTIDGSSNSVVPLPIVAALGSPIACSPSPDSGERDGGRL